MIEVEDKYTIPMPFAELVLGDLKVGDCIDMLTGSIIVGPYCVWPKQEPRYFIVNG